MQRQTIILGSSILAAGCGLLSGLDALHVSDGGVDGASFEAGFDGSLDCDGGCGASLPAGFFVVTFATTPVTCPDGTVAVAVVVDPSVASDACTCKCTMTTKATCVTSSVDLVVGDAGTTSCTTSYMALSPTAGCHTVNPFTLATNTRVDNSANSMITDAGACGNTAVGDAATLVTTTATVCEPTSCTAAESLCTPAPNQRLCIGSHGDVACPDPFTEKHIVGTTANVTCSACGSSCTIGNNQNCNSHLTLYTDTACTTGSQSATSCNIIFSAMTVKSYAYSVTPIGGCSTTETSTASTSLDQEQTICCQPGK